MITDIINGIAIKLKQAHPNTTIYRESVPQGLKEPCFIILPLEPTQEAKLPNRYWRTYPFDIHFFPKSTDAPKAEMYAMAEALFFELEHIFCCENVVRGAKMRYEIVDNVLHFFVNYDMFVKQKVTAPEFMQTIDYSQKTEE